VRRAMRWAGLGQDGQLVLAAAAKVAAVLVVVALLWAVVAGILGSP
jgi:uncharacterized membrane-anchored protein